MSNESKTVAVLGAAGTIGRRVVRFLDEWDAAASGYDLRLAGAARLDLSDPPAVTRAVRDAAVCVNCADYRLNVEVMRSCLAASTHYVDLGGLFHVTRRQLELDDAFRSVGLTAILGCGSAPGKTNLLARAAVERLGGEPAALHIWAATRDPAASDHPFPAPYSVRTLLDELHLRPVVVREGELVEVEPMSGEAEREFPAPVGRARGVYTLHSELATLPAEYPSVREASFRLCLPPSLLEKLLALDGDELPDPYVQSAEAVAVHLVEASNGGGLVVGMTITRGGSARSTAEPAARAAVELLEGRLLLPGVHAPERAIPRPEDFLALLDTEVAWQ